MLHATLMSIFPKSQQQTKTNREKTCDWGINDRVKMQIRCCCCCRCRCSVHLLLLFSSYVQTITDSVSCRFLLRNIYLCFSGFHYSFLLIYVGYGPNTCSNYTKLWHRTYLTISRRRRREYRRIVTEIKSR